MSNLRQEIKNSLRRLRSHADKDALSKAVTGDPRAGEREVAKALDDMSDTEVEDIYDKLDGDDLIESGGFKRFEEFVEEERVDEARYTYEPTNFYAARTWSMDMATDADKAAYKKGYARAQKLLVDLVSTLESLPRVNQFEDIPDAIKALRELQSGRLGSA